MLLLLVWHKQAIVISSRVNNYLLARPQPLVWARPRQLSRFYCTLIEAHSLLMTFFHISQKIFTHQEKCKWDIEKEKLETYTEWWCRPPLALPSETSSPPLRGPGWWWWWWWCEELSMIWNRNENEIKYNNLVMNRGRYKRMTSELWYRSLRLPLPLLPIE